MSRRLALLLVALLVAVAVLAIRVADAGTTDDCPDPAFAWGGDGRCWGRDDGEEFAAWLAAHGSSAARFEENYPELAAVFRDPWPPEPEFWRTCETGPACARAVIPHYFEDWRYWYRIASCETGGTFSASAVGDAGERGWFQIHPVHAGSFDWDRLFDPRYNTQAAWRLSSHGTDATPWACA